MGPPIYVNCHITRFCLLLLLLLPRPGLTPSTSAALRLRCCPSQMLQHMLRGYVPVLVCSWTASTTALHCSSCPTPTGATTPPPLLLRSAARMFIVATDACRLFLNAYQGHDVCFVPMELPPVPPAAAASGTGMFCKMAVTYGNLRVHGE